MHEPILDVAMPNDVARLGRSLRAGDAMAEKIVVVQQIFTNIGAQENVRQVCRTLRQEAGVQLIAVEGADTKVTPRPEAKSVAILLKTRCRVSAGVEVFLNVDRPQVTVWGVDDLASESSSLAAMTRAHAAARSREQVFRWIRKRLREAQRRCYNSCVARLRQLQCPVYGRWEESSNTPGLTGYPKTLSQPFAKVVRQIIGTAREEGLELRDFDAIPLYLQLLERERRLRAERVRAEQTTFIERLVSRILSATGEKGDIECQAIEPIVQFWAEENEVSKDEFDQAIKLRGIQNVLGECFQWIMGWLTERAIAARTGGIGAPEVIEEMMRLSLRLNVPFFDLTHFRDAIAYQREAAALSAMGLFDQVTECGRMVASRTGSSDGAKLFDLEQGLEQLYLALRLELIPADAEATEITLPALFELVRNVCELGGRTPSDISALRLESLSPTLDAAREFYDRSHARGRFMAEKTLELMKTQGEDRAILVAGGFHERAITRTLEDHRNVSWSVLTPQPKY